MHVFSCLRPRPQEKSLKNGEEIPTGFDWGHANTALISIANMAEATGLTPLKGAAEAVKHIVEIAETTGKKRNPYMNTAKHSFELVVGLKRLLEGKKPEEVDQSLIKDVQKFQEQWILLNLIFIKTEEAREGLIINQESHMPMAMIIHSTFNHLSINVVQGDQNNVNTLHGNQTDDQSRITYDKLEQATPADPVIFYGREDLVKEAVEYITKKEQALLAILGPGGIGKTTLALKIKEELALREKFGNKFYFMPCDILPDVASFVQGVIQCLKVLAVQEGKGQMEILFEYFQTNTKTTLFILDNFETTWNSKEGRTDIQRLLAKLVKFKHLSIIVTMRGVNSLGDKKWHALGTESCIPPLSMVAAQEMFIEIAGDKFDSAQSPEKINELLQKIDCVPLAVQLMAKRAKTNPIKSLLRMWELSVKLLNKNACKLLSIIAFLPNGIPMWNNNLDKMLPHVDEPDTSAADLLEWAWGAKESGTAYHEHSENFIDNILENVPKLGIDQQIKLQFDRISALIWNADKEVEDEIERIETRNRGNKEITARCQQSRGRFFIIQSRFTEAVETLSGAKTQFEEIGNQHGAVQCLQSLGEIACVEGRLSEAAEVLSRAKTQFEEIGDQHGAVHGVSRALGRLIGRFSEGAEMLSRVKAQFEEIGDQRGAVQCLQSLGEIAFCAGQIEAKTQFEEIGDTQHGAVLCLQLLGEIDCVQGRLSEAAEVLSRAKTQFEEIGNQHGAAQCLQSLGEMDCVQSRFSEGAEMLSRAKTQFEEIGDQWGAVQCLHILGEIPCVQGRFSEAAEMLSRAKTQFEEIGDQHGAVQQGSLSEAAEMLCQGLRLSLKRLGIKHGAVQCLQSLGEIDCVQGRLSEAAEVLSRAKTQFEEIGNQHGAAQWSSMSWGDLSFAGQIQARTQFEEIGDQQGAVWCLHSLGEIPRVQGRFSEAAEILSRAKTQFEEIGDQHGAVQCLQGLGEIAHVQGRLSEAAEMLCHGLRLSLRRLGIKHGAVQCLQGLGEIPGVQGRLSEAAEVLSRAKTQFEEIGHQHGAAYCLQRTLGRSIVCRADSVRQLKLCQVLRLSLKRLGISMELSSVFKALERSVVCRADSVRQLKLLSRVKTQFEEIGDQHGAVQCLQSLGEIDCVQSRFSEAADVLLRAKTQFEEIGNLHGVVQCLQSLGEIDCVQGRLSEAAEVLSRAKTLFEEIGDQHGAGRLSEAAEVLSRAKTQFEEIGDQHGAVQCLQSLGEIAGVQGRFSEAAEILSRAETQFEEIGNIETYRCEAAAEMLSRAKTQFEEIGDQQGAAMCLQSFGNIVYGQSRYSEAAEILTRAKTQFEEIGDQQGAAQCLKALGEVYCEQSSYSEAAEMLSKAKTQFEEIGDQQGAAMCLQSLGNIDYGQSRYSEAAGILI
ncbi:TPR-like protein [Dendrothele bispora CBS 962.96]|uniref:TPR-like protein n=1 Tax=Dendrothele bispora (strain CBS 962.96) TaxID=1314807 RepID=A0A4S8L0J3_DENBC|nr:TPR-like protein [Dendrothele bispora CBS 962.96]